VISLSESRNLRLITSRFQIARTVRDDLPAVDDPILEGPDCQDPYGGQDPYDESMKLLATAGDGEPIEGGLKEDSDVISAP
jgi:hypothetical protein